MIPVPLVDVSLPPSQILPTRPGERNRWVLAQRRAKNPVGLGKPYAYFFEEEMGPAGVPVSTATLLLTNRECPYRCLMCDLWQNTRDERVPVGEIPAQIRSALADLPPARQIKLYNSGSFFDPQAIPPEDYPDIAEAISSFERVIVECHPHLIGERTLAFRDRLRGRLEIAVGLETVHTEVLERLNKRFTVADFQRRAAFLKENGIDLRVFLMLRPPFLTEAEGIYWAERSLDVALAAGATAACVIPTRAGNGAMEALATVGEYHPPSLRSLEAVQEYGLRGGSGRTFSDTWDIERFFTCDCSRERAARLDRMNREQVIPPPVLCERC